VTGAWRSKPDVINEMSFASTFFIYLRYVALSAVITYIFVERALSCVQAPLHETIDMKVKH
jgi:hypothetical protein